MPPTGLSNQTMNPTPNPSRIASDQVRAVLLGSAVGDALGVPAEFTSRKHLAKHPITSMTGFGTHNQPAGTWSDDSSLTFCLAESLCNGYDLADQARWFRKWRNDNCWTPHGQIFDIGVTTDSAIMRSERVTDPRLAGPREIHSNGNGSLMRIAPLALYLSRVDQRQRTNAAMDASCLTHGHVRSQLGCAFYVDLLTRVIQGDGFTSALTNCQAFMATLIESEFPEERLAFTLALDPDLIRQPIKAISGSGYVLHTLTASIWCCARAKSFQEAVLTAVNLGDDTDTTGAVTGALAGMIFGVDSIPHDWIQSLARIDDINPLCERFAQACQTQWEASS